MSQKNKNKQRNATTAAGLISEHPANAAVASKIPAVQSDHSGSSLWKVLLSAFTLALVIGLPAYFLNVSRLPTRIAADLVVSRVAFVLSKGDDPVPILSVPSDFRALTIEGLDHVTFAPKWLEHFTPDLHAGKGKWMRITSPRELILQSDSDRGATLSIEAIEPTKGAAGRLETLSAKPASAIAIQVAHAPTPAITIKIDGHAPSPSILPVGSIELAVEYASSKLSTPVFQGDRNKFRTLLNPSSPYLETVSRPSQLVVTLTPTTDSAIQLLEKSGAGVDSIDLATQNSAGNLETTLAGPGQLTYADYPNKKPVFLAEHDFIRFTDLTKMSITSLKFDNQKRWLTMRIEGTADQLATKSGFQSTDLRITWLDYIIHNAFLQYAWQLMTLLGSSILALAAYKWHAGIHNFIDALLKRTN